VRANLKETVPFRAAEAAVAVAGTATKAASIDLGLEPYDAERVEGHELRVTTLRELLERVAAVPLEERREIRGLDPARAPVIVAGVAILLEVLGFFGLDRVRVSKRDILWGAALDICSIASARSSGGQSASSEGRSCLPPPSTGT
jgi:exopolyphosphatase/guanosine-5'-triphosphate,3'-diphosphate pyrophosphatase